MWRDNEGLSKKNSLHKRFLSRILFRTFLSEPPLYFDKSLSLALSSGDLGDPVSKSGGGRR